MNLMDSEQWRKAVRSLPRFMMMNLTTAGRSVQRVSMMGGEKEVEVSVLKKHRKTREA